MGSERTPEDKEGYLPPSDGTIERETTRAALLALRLLPDKNDLIVKLERENKEYEIRIKQLALEVLRLNNDLKKPTPKHAEVARLLRIARKLLLDKQEKSYDY